jgi:hypothetical protein
MTSTLKKEVVVRVVEQTHDTYALLAAIMAILGFVIVVLGKVPRPKSTNLLVRLLSWFWRDDKAVTNIILPHIDKVMNQMQEQVEEALNTAKDAKTMAVKVETTSKQASDAVGLANDTAKRAAADAMDATREAMKAAAAASEAATAAIEAIRFLTEHLQQKIPIILETLRAQNEKLEALNMAIADLKSCNYD